MERDAGGTTTEAINAVIGADSSLVERVSSEDVDHWHQLQSKVG